MNKLPMIKQPGDIIVMHRLKVSSFRGQLQGLGLESAGFSAVVFPRTKMSDDDQPYPNQSACSFTAEVLERVGALRLWWNAPECPVEKEQVTMQSFVAETDQPIASPVVFTRLHLIKAPAYANVEAQVVSIMKFQDGDDTVLYLWDGQPPPHPPPHSFFAPGDGVCVDSTTCQPSVRIDPLLAAITSHRLGHFPTDKEELVDWTVPVFIYDEHAAKVTKSIRPGDLVRIVNLHATRKVYLTDSDEASRLNWKLKLDVHGGGSRYGRRIEALDNTSSTLLRQHLCLGRELRTPFAVPRTNTCLKPIGIGDIVGLPSQVYNEASHSFVQHHEELTWQEIINEEDMDEGQGCVTVQVRVCARISQASPSTSEGLSSHFLIVCPICKISTRLNSLESGEHNLSCSCNRMMTRKRSATESHLPRVLLPVFSVILEDATGEASVLVVGNNIQRLLSSSSSSTFKEDLLHWVSAEDIRNADLSGQRLVAAWQTLVVERKDGWVDAILSISWCPSSSNDEPSLILNIADCGLVE